MNENSREFSHGNNEYLMVVKNTRKRQLLTAFFHCLDGNNIIETPIKQMIAPIQS